MAQDAANFQSDPGPAGKIDSQHIASIAAYRQKNEDTLRVARAEPLSPNSLDLVEPDAAANALESCSPALAAQAACYQNEASILADISHIANSDHGVL